MFCGAVGGLSVETAGFAVASNIFLKIIHETNEVWIKQVKHAIYEWNMSDEDCILF
jgi:hypothetical protein